MIDYEYKSKILSSQLFQEYKKISKARYFYYCATLYDDFELPKNIMSEKVLNELCIYYSSSKFEKDLKECARISKAHRKRVLTLKRRVEYMLYKPCIFLTFTFSPYALENLTEKVRKQYVKEYLSSLDCLYVANQDFGKKKGREHYHAIVQCDRVDYSKWKYGSLNGLKVRNTTEDCTKLAKYVAKLTNHAIKETNRRSVLMYSKCFKSVMEKFHVDGVL